MKCYFAETEKISEFVKAYLAETEKNFEFMKVCGFVDLCNIEIQITICENTFLFTIRCVII